jgi:hypothetical protein
MPGQSGELLPPFSKEEHVSALEMDLLLCPNLAVRGMAARTFRDA